MSKSEDRIVQYLDEALATERGLVRELQVQIAVAPRGRLRNALESHLRETRSHAERVQRRRDELRDGVNPVRMVIGAAEGVAGQAVALAKTPLDLLRGRGGEEKVLKNAKDSCAAEALEIATYTALERLARELGDTTTAELAASIRADEERMLERLQRELPALATAVARAVEGQPTYDPAESGAADAVREVADDVKQAAGKGAARARRTTRQARRVPGVSQAEGAVKGAVASEDDLAIANYDGLSADEIVARLPELSQVDLAKVDAYERRHQARTTVLNRARTLRGDEPWPGYDEMNADEVVERVRDGDEELARKVREYERAHKQRATVVRAAERELAHA